MAKHYRQYDQSENVATGIYIGEAFPILVKHAKGKKSRNATENNSEPECVDDGMREYLIEYIWN
jgi:hypothetical protein